MSQVKLTGPQAYTLRELLDLATIDGETIITAQPSWGELIVATDEGTYTLDVNGEAVRVSGE